MQHANLFPAELNHVEAANLSQAAKRLFGNCGLELGIRTNSLRFNAFDLRAEFAQFFIEVFVAAIDVVNAADLRDSFRR
jgi:hypothetical protein